jgi:hypothetical protein
MAVVPGHESTGSVSPGDGQHSCPLRSRVDAPATDEAHQSSRCTEQARRGRWAGPRRSRARGPAGLGTRTPRNLNPSHHGQDPSLSVSSRGRGRSGVRRSPSRLPGQKYLGQEHRVAVSRGLWSAGARRGSLAKLPAAQRPRVTEHNRVAVSRGFGVHRSPSSLGEESPPRFPVGPLSLCFLREAAPVSSKRGPFAINKFEQG